jgi:predicted unusual protein kinase regulating ubiquinone biosynthesis (AarF/ABC1/UbiB family)
MPAYKWSGLIAAVDGDGHMIEGRRVLDQALKRSIEETWAIFTPETGALDLPLFLARLGDLARSNAFLWMKAGLSVQEHATRQVSAGQSLSRSLVMACISADIALGYFTLKERAKWFPALVTPRDWELLHQRCATRVLETAASLGGALIKGCQFASTRPDIVPAAYTRALATLQDRMPPRPFSEIEKTIAGELHRPMAEVFADIEREPVAAASIAQVHRARLKDGRTVAVKVQYADIENLVATDLAILEQMVNVVSRLAPSMDHRPILDYLSETLPLELDFKREADAMMSLRAALANRSDVIVPAAIPEFCTGRLLVMEYIEGIKITELEALERAGISPHEVALLLNYVYGDQMLRLGVLHADPHPGNLLVQPGPRLVLLDHGLTVPLAPALVQALHKLVQALTRADFAGVREALGDAGLRLEGEVDVATLLGLAGVVLGRPDETGEESDAVGAGMQLAKSMGGLPTDLLMVGRTLSILDGITKQLDPDVDIVELAAHFVDLGEPGGAYSLSDS